MLVLHVLMLTNTEIPKQIFPFVAYDAIELSKKFLRQEHHVDSSVQRDLTYFPVGNAAHLMTLFYQFETLWQYQLYYLMRQSP